MVAYKVVRRSYNPFRWGLYSITKHSYSKRYQKGVEVFTGGYLLFAFDTLENAKDFVGDSSFLEIWTCECTGVEELNRVGRLNHIFGSADKNIWIFWQIHQSLKEGRYCISDVLMNAPKGTLGCKSLTLLKRVV